MEYLFENLVLMAGSDKAGSDKFIIGVCKGPRGRQPPERYTHLPFENRRMYYEN